MIWRLGTMSCLRIQINTGDLEINSAVCLTCFQSSKLCLKLDKDNQSKWKMQVLIMISLIKEKKSYPNLYDPVWKSKCPLNLITGCSTLGGKNCSHVITFNECFTSLWRNFFPLFFAEFWFSYTEGVLSMDCLFKVWPKHLSWIKSRLTRCHTFNVPLGFIFSHFELRNLKSRNFSNNFHQSSHLFSSACPTKFNKQGIKVNTSSCSSYGLTI